VKVVVDKSRCTGHARCHSIDAELFQLDDVGYSSVTTSEVPPGGEDAARNAVLSCPEMAIQLED
jgi:ferredoxin